MDKKKSKAFEDIEGFKQIKKKKSLLDEELDKQIRQDISINKRIKYGW